MADDREELLALRRLAELETKAGGAQPEPRQTATFQAPEPNRRAGYKSQVAQAFAASPTYGPQLQQPVPVPTEQEFRQGFKDFGRGRLEGIPSTGLGLPGDVMALANAGLGAFGAPQMPRLPNSVEVGNALFGEPTSNLQAFGRSQAIEGPAVVGGLIKGAAGAVARGASEIAPAMTQAAKSAFAGGVSADTFLKNLRGGGKNADEAVAMAKGALQDMYRERSQAYQAGIAATKQNPTVLPFDAVDDALRDVGSVGTYQGKTISEGAAKALRDVTDAIDDWRKSDPATFHTAEGFDALKQRVGNIAKDQNILPHTPAATVIDRVYGAIKDTIVSKDPGYAKAMRDYMDASEELREIEKSLSLGRKVTSDTSLRKLLSIFRNNANTNYGARVESGAELASREPRLLPALAGQELNSWMPRGVMGQVLGAGGIGATMLNPANLPSALGALAVSSPRVLGEAAFAAGNTARLGSKLLDPLKNAVVPGGNAGIGGIDPRLLAQISPQMLNQLLLGTRAPAQ